MNTHPYESSKIMLSQFMKNFNSQLDDVRVYNYALTPVQIKTLYNNGAVYFGPVSGQP